MCVGNSIDGIKHGHGFENRRDGVRNQEDLAAMGFFSMSPKQRVVGTGRPTAWRCNSCGCRRIDVCGPLLGDTHMGTISGFLKHRIPSSGGTIPFRAGENRVFVAGKRMQSSRQYRYNGRASIRYTWRTRSSGLARLSAKSRTHRLDGRHRTSLVS